VPKKISTLLTFQQSLSLSELVILSRPSDIEYLTGFKFLIPLDQEREAYLVVGKESATLIHASFSKGVVGVTSIAGCSPHQLKTVLETQILQKNIQKIGYDADSLFVSELEAIKNVGVFEPFNRQKLVDMRMKKNADEVVKIQKACEITRRAWEIVSKKLASREIAAGITELDLAKMLETKMRELGAEGLAFPTIVCFGAHSALPHHQPTSTALIEDTPILVDMGARYDSYCADMTRTIWFGQNPSPEFLHTQKIVEQAYKAVIGLEVAGTTTIKPITTPTLTAKQIDSAARSVITQAGFEKLFIHTTGHGLGLEIHEPPSLNWKNEQSVEPGMVITIEPGVYFPDQFGFRYENTILITQIGDKIGYKELTK
jgi:Xaa-Pro aminopeptidase